MRRGSLKKRKIVIPLKNFGFKPARGKCQKGLGRTIKLKRGALEEGGNKVLLLRTIYFEEKTKREKSHTQERSRTGSVRKKVWGREGRLLGSQREESTCSEGGLSKGKFIKTAPAG